MDAQSRADPPEVFVLPLESSLNNSMAGWSGVGCHSASVDLIFVLRATWPGLFVVNL